MSSVKFFEHTLYPLVQGVWVMIRMAQYMKFNKTSLKCALQ
jgi:hypothetical protein